MWIMPRSWSRPFRWLRTALSSLSPESRIHRSSTPASPNLLHPATIRTTGTGTVFRRGRHHRPVPQALRCEEQGTGNRKESGTEGKRKRACSIRGKECGSGTHLPLLNPRRCHQLRKSAEPVFYRQQFPSIRTGQMPTISSFCTSPAANRRNSTRSATFFLSTADRNPSPWPLKHFCWNMEMQW